jgi:hypothetical protein
MGRLILQMLCMRAKMDRDGAVRLEDGNVWDISK